MEHPPPAARLMPRLGAILSAIALGAGGSCVRSARGPPLAIHIALERAHQALCSAAGPESPRGLVAALPPLEPCVARDAPSRVRCYLTLPDTSFEVARISDDLVRIRVVIPQLSDHVHQVTVQRRAVRAVRGGRDVGRDVGRELAVELESRN